MLTERQRVIFDTLLEFPAQVISTKDLPDFGVDRTTVFRDLRKMVSEGLLTLEGKSYRINKQSDAYLTWDLSRPPHQKEKVRYNPRLLDDYTPNKTYLLSAEQLGALETAGTVHGVSEAAESGKPYERVLNSLLIDLTHASSNLENVNISWLDTKTLIEFGEKPGNLSDEKMRIVLNHKDAILFLNEHRKNLSIIPRDLMDLHSLLTRGLIKNESAIGALRSAIATIQDSVYMPPDNPHQIKDIFEEFCQKANTINNPFEQAFFSMAFLSYIQPFEDGNKRTSRLATNIPLVKNDLAPYSFSEIRRGDYMFGLLAFYEKGNTKFLGDAFTKAYEKSALRYGDLIRHINDGGILSTISISGSQDDSKEKIDTPRMDM